MLDPTIEAYIAQGLAILAIVMAIAGLVIR
jgi:hypothetical protein